MSKRKQICEIKRQINRVRRCVAKLQHIITIDKQAIDLQQQKRKIHKQTQQQQ